MGNLPTTSKARQGLTPQAGLMQVKEAAATRIVELEGLCRDREQQLSQVIHGQ